MKALAPIARSAAPALSAVIAAGVATLAVLFVEFAPTKVLAGAVGIAACIALALVSGNHRLFCLWGLLFCLPFDLSKRFGPILEKMGGESSFRLEMSDPFLVALVAFLIRDLWTQHRSGIRLPKVTYLWLAIAAIGCLDILLGPFRLTAAHEVFRMGKVTLLFIVITNELTTPRRILHCVAALTLAMILQSGVGLIQYKYKKHLGLEILGETGSGTMDQLAVDSVRTEKAFRAGAFLSHPNLFGVYLAGVLPLSIAGFLIRTNRFYKLLFLAGIMGGMAALVTTLSRSGWLSFAGAFAVLVSLLILHERLRRKSLLTASAAAAALAVVCIIFAGPISRRIFESKANAMMSRAEYVHDAMGMIRAKPIFGWGTNSYVYAAPPFTKYGAQGARIKYKNWLPPVHNIYLLWWAELGIVGLTLHIAVIVAVVYAGLRNLRVSHEMLFAVNVACLAAIFAFLVDGFFSFSLRFNSILRLFWVISAIVMAIHYWRLSNETPRSPQLRRPSTSC